MMLADRLKSAIGNQPKRTWKLRPEILLCPNIPKPLHHVNPRTVLGSAWWDVVRRAAYESTDFHCVACGISRVSGERGLLDAHEVYAIDYKRGRAVYVEAVPLCQKCHAYIHDGRLKALLDKHEITQARFAAVIQHGDRVLAAAGLKRLTHAERENIITDSIVVGDVAEWGQWRLVVNGVEYPPKFFTYEEWKEMMQ